MTTRDSLLAALVAVSLACHSTPQKATTQPLAKESTALVVAPPPQAEPTHADSGSGTPDSSVTPPPPSAPTIPVVRGLVMVSALHLEEGDRENTVMISEASPEGVTYTWRYQERTAAGEKVEDSFERFDSANDLAAAPRLNSMFRRGAGREEEPGYTAMVISRASYNGVRDKGVTPYTIQALPKAATGMAALGPSPSLVTLKGTLSLVSPQPEMIPLLLNGNRIGLAALHLRGRFDFQDDHREADYWVLADSNHPLILKGVAGPKLFQMVRIEIPEDSGPAEARVERTLLRECRVELPGIYFAFASAELQPASEPALSVVASLLSRHPEWSFSIEGHTDSVGNAAANQKLSVDRAEAVRTALVERHAIAPERLNFLGFGATRPREPNATLEGRARNRRVELVRSCGRQ